MIPDTKIAEIRERVDIVEVVGDYIALRRAGGNFKGVCPFHADTDPSFNVNPTRQFFHCFGCGASGDVFSFLQRIEGIDFLESARRVAGRYGIELPERPMSSAARSRAERERESSRHRLFILEEAASFFEEKLKSPQGEAARNVLRSRGIGGETAKLFRLGYAPDSWSSLIDFFKARNVPPKALEEVGLALSRQSGGFYDRFRHRLMFTITDPAGQPIAFSGRALGDRDADRTAKYINSPETPEYTKGKVLYGIYQARVPLSKSGEAILVEGNFDVVSMVQAGLENVIAPLGTALTEEQAELLRRRVQRVVVMFDGDSAGRSAAARAFPILANAGLASYVAMLPPGEDPDSFVRQNGQDATTELLSKRQGLLDQIIEESSAACDGTVQDAARRIEAMKPFLNVLRSSVESDLYRGRIAEAFKVDYATVFRYLRGTGVKGGAKQSQKGESRLPGLVEERELIGLLLDWPSLWEEALNEGTVAMVSTPPLKKLLDEIGLRYRHKESSVADLVARPDSEQINQWLAERAMVRIYDDEGKARIGLRDVREKLRRNRLGDQIKDLENQIRLANSAGDDALVLELSRKKTVLQREGETKKDEIFDAGVAKA